MSTNTYVAEYIFYIFMMMICCTESVSIFLILKSVLSLHPMFVALPTTKPKIKSCNLQNPLSIISTNKMNVSGAGVLPYCIKDGNVYFLFHQTFEGKKVGRLIEFGGGHKKGEAIIYYLLSLT